ncbi:MAG: helix-turn-helix domain-containing protein [Xanthobacteraceae bacterium]
MTKRGRSIDKSIHSAEQAAFCELIKEARRDAGLTQHDVAKRLKKPQSFVAKYEGGERRIDVVEFLAIARAIGADPLGIIRGLMRRHGRRR